MKIIYAADNRLGAASPLKEFLSHTSHQVKVAAYPRSGKLLSDIDWNLNAAKDYITQLQQDIKEYYPDLVLIDNEPIVANIAYRLDIPIVYCSALHLLDGLIWHRDQRGYSTSLEKIRKQVTKLPPGVSKFIYSPFGDFFPSLSLKNGYEWIQPYHLKIKPQAKQLFLAVIEDPNRYHIWQEILSCSKMPIILEQSDSISYPLHLAGCKFILTDGQTRSIADLIYNNIIPILTPQITDGENLLNAIMCVKLKLGIDLGQIELMGRAAIEKIDEVVDASVLNIPPQQQKHPQLHERINQLWECA